MTMNAPDIEPYDDEEDPLSPRELLPSPRVLIVIGVALQLGTALMFWPFSLMLIFAFIMLHPIVATICIPLAATVFLWLTRWAWHRNTLLVSSLHFLGCAVTLPWTFIVLLVSPHPT